MQYNGEAVSVTSPACFSPKFNKRIFNGILVLEIYTKSCCRQSIFVYIPNTKSNLHETNVYIYWYLQKQKSFYF